MHGKELWGRSFLRVFSFRDCEGAMRKPVGILVVLLLAGCAGIRQEDLDAWVGQPVLQLDKHPMFLTMPVVKTIATDGTEIRNYVNGRNFQDCWAQNSGNVTGNANPQGGSYVDYASFNSSMNCSSGFMACNNLFYIKGGIVERYLPVGSGGARCFTDDRAKPQGL